ncbi:hypothetical protein EV421DRAFT_1745201 [Armillaria borealis]|uniref:Uncharacterized protein n=1 Tax=Armillaria borealis TaxID=47425 RepID=A0AA39MD03_9AGAR|nr:hypothetical protein EV421DRAFT_1745201 [Armillaria borealis]
MTPFFKDVTYRKPESCKSKVCSAATQTSLPSYHALQLLMIVLAFKLDLPHCIGPQAALNMLQQYNVDLIEVHIANDVREQKMRRSFDWLLKAYCLKSLINRFDGPAWTMLLFLLPPPRLFVLLGLQNNDMFWMLAEAMNSSNAYLWSTISSDVALNISGHHRVGFESRQVGDFGCVLTVIEEKQLPLMGFGGPTYWSKNGLSWEEKFCLGSDDHLCFLRGFASFESRDRHQFPFRNWSLTLASSTMTTMLSSTRFPFTVLRITAPGQGRLARSSQSVPVHCAGLVFILITKAKIPKHQQAAIEEFLFKIWWACHQAASDDDGRLSPRYGREGDWLATGAFGESPRDADDFVRVLGEKSSADVNLLCSMLHVIFQLAYLGYILVRVCPGAERRFSGSGGDNVNAYVII